MTNQQRKYNCRYYQKQPAKWRAVCQKLYKGGKKEQPQKVRAEPSGDITEVYENDRLVNFKYLAKRVTNSV